MPVGENVFYIQSKGNHSGRPMIKPIPNCFVAICESQEHLDFWMSICTALWLGKKFEYLIIGSVIPFIRLREAAELLKSMKDLDTDQVKKTARQLNTIDAALKANIERTKLIQQLQTVTARALSSLL